ncbi:S1 family peptidase [Mycobacterium sp.]|uniref:S1 family peptidase n=1 Tax=Mycobacterium sp. TaxID=1785 RepID=UPI003F98D376
MALVPAQCWLRTFKITAGTHSATCFVISRHDRQWLITAKHFIDGALPGGGAMTLHRHQGDVNEQVQPLPVPLTQPGADIAVFSFGDTKLVDESMTLTPSAGGLVLSQQAFFLGYPLPDRVPIAGSIPFVKHGIVSQRAMVNGVHIWWVDGINNPGFSGGPMVFNEGGGIGTIWHVLGVVSGYITQHIAVVGGAGLVPTNSGILVVYDIKHATDAIDAFVGQTPTPPN